eukprot:2244759-Rhodomonas_salina.1
MRGASRTAAASRCSGPTASRSGASSPCTTPSPSRSSGLACSASFPSPRRSARLSSSSSEWGQPAPSTELHLHHLVCSRFHSSTHPLTRQARLTRDSRACARMAQARLVFVRGHLGGAAHGLQRLDPRLKQWLDEPQLPHVGRGRSWRAARRVLAVLVGGADVRAVAWRGAVGRGHDHRRVAHRARVLVHRHERAAPQPAHRHHVQHLRAHPGRVGAPISRRSSWHRP